MAKKSSGNLLQLFLTLFFALSVFCFAAPASPFAHAFFETTPSASASSYSNSPATSQGELSEKFFLFNTSLINFPQNPIGLTPNVGDQKKSTLCWAFSTLSALETSLYTLGLVNKSTPLNFSELDLAYNTLVQSRRWSDLGKGGAFEVAYEYLSSDSGPAYEAPWERSQDANVVWSSAENSQALADFYSAGVATNGRELAGFSVLESVFFPSRTTIEADAALKNLDENETSLQILANRTAIKNHIKNFGGVTASMLYHDNNYFLRNLHYCCTTRTGPANHMVTLVGWNDEVIINGVPGAYIAQNSYGTSGTSSGEGGFFYISYADKYIEDHVCGFSRIAENLSNALTYDNMQGSDFENQFVTFDFFHENIFTSYNAISNIFSANIYPIDASVQGQYLSRIKVPTMSVDWPIEAQNQIVGYRNYDATTFKLYVLNDLTSYGQNDLKDNFNSIIPIKNAHPHSMADEYLFSAAQTGFFTVELDQQVFLSGNYFAIILEIQNGLLFFMDNDPQNLITHGTYTSSQPSKTWQIYSASGMKCVIPMKVQTQFLLADIDATVQGGTFTYDGQAHNPTVEINSPASCLVAYSLDGTNFSSNLPNLKNVKISGTQVLPHTVFVKLSADFHKVLIVQVEILINPKNIFITPQSVFSTYGDAYIQPVVNSISGIITGENYKTLGVLSVENFSQTGLNNVGEYSIIQGNFTLVSNGAFSVSNYSIFFTSGVKYTVSPKTLIVIPHALSKSYGDADPTFTCHFDGTESTQNPSATFTLIRQSGEAVGDYLLSLFGSLTLNDHAPSGFFAANYTPEFSTQPVHFSITPRVLIVTPASEQHKNFEDDDPPFTYSLSNTLVGETAMLEGSLSRTPGESVGNYQITLGTLALLNNPPFQTSNYALEISHTVVYFTILGSDISGSFVRDISVNYNGKDHFIFHTATIEYSVRICEVLSEQDVFDPQKATSENIGKKDAGTYFLIFEFKKENYATKYELAKITISPLPLFITPTAGQSKVYGEADDLSLFSFDGEIPGEVPHFSGSLSRESGENVGEYAITQGSLVAEDSPTFQASNYFLVFEHSNIVTFAITPKALTITPDDFQEKFYGKSTPALTFTFYGLEFGDAITPEDFFGSLTFDCLAQNAGEYPITLGTLSLSQPLAQNYFLALSSQTKFFTIYPAAIKISLFNLTDANGIPLKNYYGEWTFSNVSYVFLEGTEANFVSGDSLDLLFVCYESAGVLISPSTPKGDYPLTAHSQNANYSVNVSSTTFTISYRTYLVTFVVEELSLTRTKNIEHFSSVGTLPEGIALAPDAGEGYLFICWQKSTNGTVWTRVENITTETIDCITNFRAKIEPITYTITFIDSSPLTEEYFNVTDAFLLPQPTKTGHTFQGFFKNSNFSGDIITQIEQGTVGDIILFAKWQANKYTVTRPPSGSKFTITTNPTSSKITFGTTYLFYVSLTEEYNQSYPTMTVQLLSASSSPRTLSPIVFYDSSGSVIQHLYEVEGFESDFELSIFGIEAKNTYSVTFFTGREVLQTLFLTHGSSLAAADFPAIPEKQFFNDTMAVWSITSDIQNITSNKTIHAIYTPNIYVITFVMQDGREIQVETSYGTPVNISVLEDEYNLNIFERFVFSSSLQSISEDQTINVQIVSNIHIFYLILAAISILIAFLIIHTILTKKRRRA